MATTMKPTEITKYAEAMIAVAMAEGNLAVVEDELFAIAETLGSSEALRASLSDSQIPAARRQQMIEDLLEGKASTTTVALVSMVVANGRSDDLTKIVAELATRSAAVAGPGGGGSAHRGGPHRRSEGPYGRGARCRDEPKTSPSATWSIRTCWGCGRPDR